MRSSASPCSTATTGRRGLYLLPMGFATHHVHVWKSLLERAGFTLADIPKEWEAFWSFWCDQVQPAVRKALGRDDIWGIGLPMSATSVDTENGFWQFVHAYEADYVTRDGRLVIDDPEVRRRLIKAIDSYTAIYRKGCTPPDSVTWDGYGNNEQFLAQTIVMTPNQTLSIPNALKTDAARRLLRQCRDDRLARRRLRPAARHRDLRQSRSRSSRTAGTSRPRRSSCASWSARAGSRTISTSPASACCRRCRSCSRQPFWLDPSDPHRMRSAIQLLTQPRSYDYVAVSGDWRHTTIGTGPSGRKPSTASPPTASAPSRRSTRRSRASSRS